MGNDENRSLALVKLAVTAEQFLDQIARLSVIEHGGGLQDKLDCYRYVLERIAYGEHLWTSDGQGRRYSLVTKLKRELRSLLLVEGQSLQQIDIANSQLTFLALQMRSKGVECLEFVELCEKGQLNESVASQAGKSRSAVKKAITQRALFSANDLPHQRTKIKTTFDRMFPEVAAYLKEAKGKPDGPSKLAKSLQHAEADLVVRQICGRLRREGKAQFVSPIHDCLIFLPEDGSIVKESLEVEFSKLGILPRLEVKDL